MNRAVERRVRITIAADKPATPLKRFYSAVGYVNVDFTLSPPTRRMYDYLSSFHNHVQYIRMHNTLTAHGLADRFLLEGDKDFGNAEDLKPGTADCVVGLDPAGNLRFDWTVLDEAYDRVVGEGMRIIVETDFLPSCLRQSEQLWYVPRDFTLWHETIRSFVAHLEGRYGSEEIQKWYFEIWNEPDIFPAWRENPQSFFALYDYMERAVHAVNPLLKVGGPAVTQFEAGVALFGAFLQHCSTGVNYASGRIGTRIDFLSVHCKAGTLEDTNPSAERIFASLDEFRRTLERFPQFRSLELFNDESGIVWGGNKGVEDHSWLNFRNTHYSAGFICKLADQYCRRVQDQWGLDFSIMDIDNCQLQWERSLFSGHRSQLTPLFGYPSTDLIRKPVFNAYVLLSRLGDERLQVFCRHPDFGRKYGCLASRASGEAGCNGSSLSVMVWNFEDGIEDDVNPRHFLLRVTGLSGSGRRKLIHYRIDGGHSNAYRVWVEQGKPPRPSPKQIAALRAAEGLRLLGPVTDVQGSESLSIRLELPMHGVSLLQLVPENRQVPRSPVWIKGVSEEGAWGHPQVFLKWKPNAELDFLHYRLWRKQPTEGEFRLLCGDASFNTAVYVDTEVQGAGTYCYRLEAVNASGVLSERSGELTVVIPRSVTERKLGEEGRHSPRNSGRRDGSPTHPNSRRSGSK